MARPDRCRICAQRRCWRRRIPARRESATRSTMATSSNWKYRFRTIGDAPEHFVELGEAGVGFEAFELLRPDNAEAGGRYFVYTRWASKGDFENWMSSRQFSEGHRHAGSRLRECSALLPRRLHDRHRVSVPGVGGPGDAVGGNSHAEAGRNPAALPRPVAAARDLAAAGGAP